MPCPFCPPNVNDECIRLENELSLSSISNTRYCKDQESSCHAPIVNQPLISPQKNLLPHSHSLAAVKGLIDAEYSPQGYNLGWNCGAVAGQTVFHAHLHVIPRYESEPYAGKGIRYWLKQESNRRNAGKD